MNPTTARPVVITGGAGFIGCNLADRLVHGGHEVVIFDNLSRWGSEHNLAWLRERHGQRFTFIQGDIRDAAVVDSAVEAAGIVYHLASQTAVTTSVVDPRSDFETNVQGTFNILEGARKRSNPPIVVYASTNKVYGGMEQVPLVELPTRYQYRDLPRGVPETHPLDFHSPYGCSKGAADQYVRDYFRIYGVPTVVLRQSCIFGPRQMGVEDQGWIAWFIIALITGNPITIYGNGKQVRDLLYVDDLVDVYELVARHIDIAAGQIYNIGGGPENTLSVWLELKPILQEALGRTVPEPRFMPQRPGDQPIFVADTAKAERELGWSPRVDVRDGIMRLAAWVSEHPALFKDMRS